MPETRIDNAVSTDLTSAVTDFSVQPERTNGPGETSWMNTRYTQYLAYFKKTGKFRRVVIVKAKYILGQGFIADEPTTMLLESIRGNGKDTINSILQNLGMVREYGGDCYAEIVNDDDDVLINLKPMDPSSMEHIIGKDGMLKHFLQHSTVKGKKPEKFELDKIFYMARDRIADEPHGISLAEAIEFNILATGEGKTDWKRVMHRNIDPLWIYHLDTDDVDEIAAYKIKMDTARGKGENMYVPKGVIVPELVSVAANANLNPLPWLERLDDELYEESGVPKVVVGGVGGITDAAVKMSYLSFEQTIKSEQLEWEQQILAQLNLEIKLTPPASLQGDLISEEEKAGEPTAAEPNDTTAELEGRK